MKPIPFFLTNWSEIQPTEHKGESCSAFWKSLNFEGLRVWIVEYSPGYWPTTGAAKVTLYIASMAKWKTC